jgi:hypothetical protein
MPPRPRAGLEDPFRSPAIVLSFFAKEAQSFMGASWALHGGIEALSFFFRPPLPLFFPASLPPCPPFPFFLVLSPPFSGSFSESRPKGRPFRLACIHVPRVCAIVCARFPWRRLSGRLFFWLFFSFGAADPVRPQSPIISRQAAWT